jgi:hypothetical protein
VEYDLEVCAKKTHFSCIHTHKNFLLDNNKGYILVSLPRKCKFSLCFEFVETRSLRSHRAHDKEHMQTKKHFLLCF